MRTYLTRTEGCCARCCFVEHCWCQTGCLTRLAQSRGSTRRLEARSGRYGEDRGPVGDWKGGLGWKWTRSWTLEWWRTSFARCSEGGKLGCVNKLLDGLFITVLRDVWRSHDWIGIGTPFVSWHCAMTADWRDIRERNAAGNWMSACRDGSGAQRPSG